MKIRTEYITQGEEEIVLRLKEDNQKLKETLEKVIESKNQKMTGICGNDKILFSPSTVYYFEYVDGRVFAYFADSVCNVTYSLEKLSEILTADLFFRCSKSMIINLDFVERFTSCMGNRIIATMQNKEEVIISRHYAKLLRAWMKGEEE